MDNEVIVTFCIWGFEDMSHEEISKAIGLSPTKIHIQGQKKNPRYSALAKENGWLFRPSDDSSLSFEDQFRMLLGILEDKTSILEVVCKKYYCEISCGVFIYFDNEESTPSIHIDSEQHKILSDLNIAFDVDLYCLPNSDSSSKQDGNVSE